jgi:SAM-dependent methyltransferase
MNKLIACASAEPASRISILFNGAEAYFREALRGKYVLEVGCGTGKMSVTLAQLSDYFVGTEITAEYLPAAQERLKSVLSSDKFELLATDGTLESPKNVHKAPYRVTKGGAPLADVAIWNPPQKPTPDGEYAGKDGLYWIKEFLAHFDDLVHPDGELYFSCTNLVNIKEIKAHAVIQNLNLELIHQIHIPMFPELNPNDPAYDPILRTYIDKLHKDKGLDPLTHTLTTQLYKATKKAQTATSYSEI